MLRWVCKKCNKKWIYPVEKCIYCKGKLEEELGKKFKVIGITKVNIPSPMHPVVPYNILILEDDYGNKMPKKTMKDYNIGDEFVYEKGEVSIIKIKYNIYEAVRMAFELIGGINVNKNTKVLIKPDISSGNYPYLGTSTNPEVVEAVIKVLMKHGVTNITMADQGTMVPIEKSAGKTGFAKLCAKYKIKLVDLSQSEFEQKNGFEVSRELATHDFIINIPVMKTHCQLTMVGALYNMLGCCSVKTQKQLAKENISNTIPELFKLLPKQLIIADATKGMQGNGPTLGEPLFFNMVLASNDPVAVDATLCNLGFLDIPDYVKNTEGEHKPTIGGDDVESNRLEIKKAEYGHTPNLDIKIVGTSFSQITYDTIIAALGKLATVGAIPTHIALGSVVKRSEVEDKRVIAVGDDAIKAMQELKIEPIDKIKGEPPDIVELIVFLKKLFTAENSRITIIDRTKAKIMKTMIKGQK